MVEVPPEEAPKVDLFYCAVDSFGAGGAAMMTTQAGEIMNVSLKDYRWKFTCKCHECDLFGCNKLPCDEREVPRPAGVPLAHTWG